MELGGKFWLMLIGGAIAAGIAGIVFFLVMEAAWMRWGFLGGFLFFAAILLLFGWLFDRRERQRREESLDAANVAR
jgi:membrane protein implicated in regulation of membrane protease activity